MRERGRDGKRANETKRGREMEGGREVIILPNVPPLPHGRGELKLVHWVSGFTL